VPSPCVRTFHHRDFSAAALARLKAGRTVTVCLPARDEEATVGRIVGVLRRELVDHVALVDEILVIDDGSVDGTAATARAAGSRVIDANAVLADHGPSRGKGDAMWRGLFEADGDLVVFCDADVRNFGPRFVVGLLGPLLTDDAIGFVKGFYERPLDGRAGEGGRVTELVARPLLSLLFPALTTVVQPLAGECAARREVLEAVPFVDGYGVEMGLLVDVARRFGIDALAQVDLGNRVHRNRPLPELAEQSMAILQTALDRAGIERGAEWSSILVRPTGDAVEVAFSERPPLAEIGARRTA
jgi:glucosyl-3-phosphoglycerate synthase